MRRSVTECTFPIARHTDHTRLPMQARKGPQRGLVLWCIFCVGSWLLWPGCGGEISVSRPGCEECPERCSGEENGRHRCLECINDSHCRSGDSTKKCIDQKCVCGTDKDCPNNQRCAGQLGCVECLRDSHCEDAARPACGPDNRCAACQPKATRACVPEGSNACIQGTQICRSNGQWDTCTGAKACASNEICTDHKCVLDCPPAPCQATETKCSTSPGTIPGAFLRCIKNEKGCLEWSATERACAAKEFCDKGQCLPFQCPLAPCQLDETRCVGSDAHRRCVRNAQGCVEWANQESCPAQSQCREALKRCTVCIPKEERTCYSGPAATQNKGPCKAGKQTCHEDGSGWSACLGEVLPQKESCDGIDNNCDGQIDEDFPDKGKTCTIGMGACQASGTIVCQSDGLSTACNAKPAASTVEICDNKDNDCDGNIDDHLTRPCYNGPANTNNKGICKDGTQTCTAGIWSACTGEVQPAVEACNGQDDNCDGQIDEALQRACFSGATNVRNKGACKDGTQPCTSGTWGACTGEVLPQAEICNNIDDNCDGSVDEGLTQSCYTGPANTAGLGVCQTGTQTCVTGQWSTCAGEVKPGAETCNNQDDNCDGIIDNNVTRSCYTGPANTAGVGPCKTGIETCTTGQWGTCQGQVTPAAQENCTNGIDDDCNGSIDDCAATFLDIRSTIDTDTGKIDGVLSPGWKTNGRFELAGSVRIAQNLVVKVTGRHPLQLIVTGDVVLDGTLALGGKQGGHTNCQTAGAGQEGAGAGGGGGSGGAGGGCNTTGGGQPPGGTGLGASPGAGGAGGNATAGGGGGGGHANPGGNGLPTGLGGKGGLPTGSPTSLTPGSGGGGGGCGVAGVSILSIYTPGAGGGGGGGAVVIDATNNITIAGSILAGGGSGGDAPTCDLGTFGSSTGGGGAGGSGGSIRLRAKQQLTLQSTAYLSAEGGSGGGKPAAKGGDGSPGTIRLEDNNGMVSVPTGRVLPLPSIATY